MVGFQCPSDCGRCCTQLARPVSHEEAEAEDDFRAQMRELGVYACADPPNTGLSMSGEEAQALREEAARLGLVIDLHPRTFLLETAKRVAVVLDWHLAHASCPFYADGLCRAYERRPLVCRAFPVVAPAPRWRLSKECPLTEPTLEGRDEGRLRLGTHLRLESAARRGLDERLAQIDDAAFRLLDDGRHRFARGLAPREAAARLARYPAMDAATLLAA